MPLVVSVRVLVVIMAYAVSIAYVAIDTLGEEVNVNGGKPAVTSVIVKVPPVPLLDASAPNVTVAVPAHKRKAPNTESVFFIYITYD